MESVATCRPTACFCFNKFSIDEGERNSTEQGSVNERFLEMCERSTAGEIDQLEVDLLNESERLKKRAITLEEELVKIEEAIYKKYPEIETACLVLRDIRFVTDRTRLRRRSILLRMKEQTRNMVKAAYEEITCEQWHLNFELIELNKRIEAIEEKIKNRVRNRHYLVEVEEDKIKKARIEM